VHQVWSITGKVAVLSRAGGSIVFNLVTWILPTTTAFKSGLWPIPAPGKRRVENGVGYVKKNSCMVAAVEFSSVIRARLLLTWPNVRIHGADPKKAQNSSPRKVTLHPLPYERLL